MYAVNYEGVLKQQLEKLGHLEYILDVALMEERYEEMNTVLSAIAQQREFMRNTYLKYGPWREVLQDYESMLQD